MCSLRNAIKEYQIWLQSGSDRPQMGQILDFSDQITVKMYWNLIWKSPELVPFDANLPLFDVKPDISDENEIYVKHKAWFTKTSERWSV